MSVKTTKEDEPPMNIPQIAHSFDDKRRTGDILIGENLDFAGLFLSPAVLQGLSEAGFRNPSPIQLKAIPLGRCGLDLIVQAKSGTGKTCVFTVIALEGLLIESCSVQVLVLAPTREIALQIQDVIVTIGQKVTGLTCQSFIGGLPLSQDKERVKRCHVAVGTPGRVKQLIEENILATDSIRLFILDEADKLLEEGFQEQINWIYSTLPDNKQMVALSATYPEYLANHLTAYMRNPTFVRLNTLDPALLGIKQFYQELPFQPLPQKAFEEKSKSLIALLSSISFQQCLVFSNLQVAAENLSDLLNSKGWPSAFIAGSQDQKLRMKAMEKLKKYECRILISTDLTSRGIDADKVDLVVNLDLPWDHETYLHRIGRAGRFGAYGAAVSFVVKGKESTRLADIQEKCHTVIKPLPEPVPSNLTQPVGHVCLDDMVTTEQLVTTPQDDPSNGHMSETHSKVKHAPRPSDRRINGDAVMEMTSETKGNERGRDAEIGGNVDGGKAGNEETNGGENVSLRKQTVGTKSLESSVEGSVNGHHRIIEGDVRSQNVSPALTEEEDSVNENGQRSLSESRKLGLYSNKNEVSASTAQTGTEARVEDAFEKLTRVSDKEDVASNNENDKAVTLERGLVSGEDDEVTADGKSNGLSQNGVLMDKKKKSRKKDTGKTIAYSSRELRSYSDLDFDVNEHVEIPEFGVESSGFGVRSAKSGARSSKFSDQFAWSKPAAHSSKSGSKVSKSGARISDVTVSKDQSGNQASLSATKPATQETINKLSRLEEKLGVEFVSKLANSSARKADSACTTKVSQSAVGKADSSVTSEISAPNVQLGSKMLNKKQVHETETDSVKKENGLGNEINKPAIDQKWGRKQESGALSVSESISKYLTNYATDQIENQKQKVYHNFAEAKVDYLKFKSNNADMKIGTCRTVSSSEALTPSQAGAANRLDVTLRDITCLLNEFHRDQKTILSSVGQSVVKTDGEPESNLADGSDGKNDSKTQDLPVVESQVTAENGRFPKCANEGAVTTVSDQKLDFDPSALSSDKDRLPTESATVQNHLHDSVVAPIQETGEIKQSRPLRPMRKRRAPSEEKKRRGMAATLAIVQGRVEPIMEEDAKTTEEEQTPEKEQTDECEQTAKCLEFDLKEAGSVSSDVCGEKSDFVSHPKNHPCDKKSSVPDKKTSVLELESSVFDSESGVPRSETDVSVGESGHIDGRKNEAEALIKATDSSGDEAESDEVFVVQDGVVLRIKRTPATKNDMDSLEDESFGEEAEEHAGVDDDDDGSDDDDENHTDDSDSDDDDSESDSDDGDESYRYSDSECDSSESEPDFVEEVGGLCYRQGYSKVERLHMTWSKRPGVDREVSAAAEIDLGVEKSIEGEPHSFEEQRFVGLSADTEVWQEPFDLSVRPKAPFSTAREKSKSSNRHLEQTQHAFHNCHGDFQEQFESSGAFSGNHGNAYSKGFEDPDEFHEEQGPHWSLAADYGCHNNQYDQPRYHDGNYSDQYVHPEYQTGSYGNHYHQDYGYNGSYGNQPQYSYRGNHQTPHDYTRYQDSPYYQDYLYHMQEAERLEQKMKDEMFNKQMELYMHKAYVIQNMCMNQMKQYHHSKKEV